MKVHETLNKAADLIEEHGWATGGGWPGEKRYGGAGKGLCLEGGIMAALGIDMRGRAFATLAQCPAYAAVKDHLDTLGTLYQWNDAPERTAGEVIETLRACALIEEAREQQDEAFATYAENLEAAR